MLAPTVPLAVPTPRPYSTLKPRPAHEHGDEMKSDAKRCPGEWVPYVNKQHKEGDTREAVFERLIYAGGVWTLRITFDGLARPMPLSADARTLERRVGAMTAQYDLPLGVLPTWEHREGAFTLTFKWRDERVMVLAG